MQFRKIRLGVALLLMAGCSLSKAAAQSLYTLPDGVQTRWASAENPGGEKGKGAQTERRTKGPTCSSDQGGRASHACGDPWVQWHSP